VDLSKLCTFGGARLIMAEVCHIDTYKKEIACTDGRPVIRYDILSINVGISPQMNHLNPNAESSMTPVKPIVGFANRWDIILEKVLSDETDSVKRIVIVGGGAGGVELCFAMNHRLKTSLVAQGRDPGQAQMVLATRGDTILAEHNKYVYALYMHCIYIVNAFYMPCALVVFVLLPMDWIGCVLLYTYR
jgi:selenide,water dikinase